MANLDQIILNIQEVAQSYQGNPVALLNILRRLESLHLEIRESLFQECLPENRQQLYHLLRDIETEGGWPYIPRMRIQALLAKLALEPIADEAPQPTNYSDQ